MTEPTEIQEQWKLPSLVDYYDFDQEALVKRSSQLALLDEAEQSIALSSVAETVAAMLAGFDDDFLPDVALSMLDDLYKSAIWIVEWGPAQADYIRDVWGTLFRTLTERGFTMRYVIDNTFPLGLERPLSLLPELFGQAGIVYVCPHQLALGLPEAANVEHSVDGLRQFIGESRHLANELVERLVTSETHVVYLELDYEEGCLDVVRSLRAAPGTILVFRNEEPVAGSSVEMKVVPLATVSEGQFGRVEGSRVWWRL